MRGVFLLLFVAGTVSISPAQESDTLADPVFPEYYESVEQDSAVQAASSPAWVGEEVQVNKFDETHWKKTIGAEKYEEARDEEEPQKDKAKDDGNTRIAPWDSDILKVIAWVVIGALIVFVLYKLTKTLAGPGAIVVKRNDLNAGLAEIENIEDVDIRSPLEKALSNGDYRLAIRLYYLQLLKLLNEGGVIRWKKDKTNRDYLFELFQANYYHDEIRALTLSYEEVWYGEHILADETLKDIIQNFENVTRQVNPTAR